MNEQEMDRIVEEMVEFIEKKEQDYLASKIGKGSQSQNGDVVKAILSKLEKEMEDED